MLSSNDRGGKGNSEEDLEQQTAEQLKSFAFKMENFVNAQGDLEGARFDDEKSDEDEEDLDEDEGEDAMDLGLDENGDEEDDEMDIDEDPEGQARNKEQEEIEALEKAQIKLAELSTEERETATKKLISSLNNEEWGAKNAESAKRAANMAKKMAAEPSTSKQESDSMEVDSSQVEQEEFSTEDQENTSAATLRGLGRNQHFDGDSDEEESLDGDDDTAEEKADRAAWLGLDEPNPESTENSSSNRKDSIASTTQGFDGEGAEMENTGEEDEESTMQTEMDGFLEFSRRALGLSDEHYAKILSERTARGGEYCISRSRASSLFNLSNLTSDSSIPHPFPRQPIRLEFRSLLLLQRNLRILQLPLRKDSLLAPMLSTYQKQWNPSRLLVRNSSLLHLQLLLRFHPKGNLRCPLVLFRSQLWKNEKEQRKEPTKLWLKLKKALGREKKIKGIYNNSKFQIQTSIHSSSSCKLWNRSWEANDCEEKREVREELLSSLLLIQVQPTLPNLIQLLRPLLTPEPTSSQWLHSLETKVP